jgi:hypothetical protein
MTYRSRLGVIRQVALALTVFATASVVHAATSIAQYGITWTFAADMTTGQFANGDYWVVGPVTITNITPASTLIGGRTMNGSMVNPTAGLAVSQGFDSTMTANKFSAALNAARPNGSDLSAGNPLVLAAGSSLVSTISHSTAGRRPQLTDAAVLTVLAAPPPANAFRPPYCGTNKAIIATEADIDYSKVASLAKPSSTPDLTTVANYFRRPWIEIVTEYGGREMHPSNNQPDYGREIGKRLSEGLLSLQLNYTNAQKRDLMVRLVQYGLDVYGSAVTGGFWRESGGHNQGRKMPLLLAATVLNNSSIKAYGNAATRFIFQEDRQTFYVTQATVDITNSIKWDPDPRGGTPVPYSLLDIGLAEWGINAVRNPPNNDKAWTALYRTIAGSSMFGHVLTAHIMGLRSTWNWEPLFTYIDRYWTAESVTKPGTNTPSQFERDMWVAYRGTTVVPTPPPPPPPAILAPTNATLQIEVQP